MLVPRIDAHHHLWHYVSSEFGWIDDNMAGLRRDFLPADLAAVLSSAGVAATIAIQARSSLEESRFLLHCAFITPAICAVVGWVPLADTAALSTALDEFCTDPAFVGVREITQGWPNGALESASFSDGIAQLTERGLTYDLLLYPNQLAEATRLVDRHPHQSFILDHCAKPQIAAGDYSDWAAGLRELARRPNVTCKLSGLVTEASWTAWTLADLRPYLDLCVEAFGVSRLLSGSDWPVCLVASGYSRWWSALETYFAAFTSAEQAAVFGGVAIDTYSLKSLLP